MIFEYGRVQAESGEWPDRVRQASVGASKAPADPETQPVDVLVLYSRHVAADAGG